MRWADVASSPSSQKETGLSESAVVSNQSVAVVKLTGTGCAMKMTMRTVMWIGLSSSLFVGAGMERSS